MIKMMMMLMMDKVIRVWGPVGLVSGRLTLETGCDDKGKRSMMTGRMGKLWGIRKEGGGREWWSRDVSTQ